MSDENAVVISEAVQLGVIQTTSPQDVVNKASEIATAVSQVVEKKRLYTIIRGRKYVHVEGWTTMGALLGVTPREVECHRLDDGGYVGTVELVRGDGAIIGRASAMVGMDEKDSKGNITWGKRDEYARYSFALTRATGKAYRLAYSWIMQLAGYAPTPAEEMNPDDKPFDNELTEGQYREPGKQTDPKSTEILEPIPHKDRDLLSPEKLKELMASKAEKYDATRTAVTEDQRKNFLLMVKGFAENSDELRHAFCQYVFDDPSHMSMTAGQIMAGLDWMKNAKIAKAEFKAVIEHLSGEIHENGDVNNG